MSAVLPVPQLQRTVSHEPVRNHHRRRRADRRADRDLRRAHKPLDAHPRPRPVEPLDWQHHGLRVGCPEKDALSSADDAALMLRAIVEAVLIVSVAGMITFGIAWGLIKLTGTGSSK